MHDTIHERLERGFLSDTPEGKEQIRAAKVRSFFRDYENWRFSDDDDGHEMQCREHELQITQKEWLNFWANRRARQDADYARNPF